MMNSYGQTTEQINQTTIQKLGESVEKRSKEKAERLENMGNSLAKSFSKQYDLNELVKIGNQFEDGSLAPAEYGVEKCIAFSGKCEIAIRDLEKQRSHMSTTAGYAYMQGKLDIYKEKAKQAEVLENQINLLRRFI